VAKGFAGMRLAAIAAAFLLALGASPAGAAVEASFYSHELGSSFPHAFVVLDGTLDRDGARIAEDYGFSAKTISPAILMGRVKGEVSSDHNASYVKGSNKHFTLTLSDEEYDQLMVAVERWRTAKQPSYDLGKANCVHFVAELAAAIGMEAAPIKGLMKKPRSYLDRVTASNRGWLVARGAVIHRGEAAAASSAAP
jgi:hypothetical protein